MRTLPGLPLPEAQSPVPTAVSTLDNGTRLVALQRSGSPLLEVRMRVPLPVLTPAEVAAVSLLVDAFLLPRPGLIDPAATLADLGATVRLERDTDRLLVVARCLWENGEAAILIMRRLLEQPPTLATADVARLKGRLLSRLERIQANSQAVARLTLLRDLWGPAHVAAREVPAVEALQAVVAADVSQAHHRILTTSGCTLLAATGADCVATLKLLEAAWPQLPANAEALDGSERAEDDTDSARQAGLRIVDRPGAVQVSLRLAGLAPSRQEPDYAAAQLASLVLGGFYASRLMASLRERQGWVYAPKCLLDPGPTRAAVLLDMDTQTANVVQVLDQLNSELELMVQQAPGNEELDTARHFAVGSLALSCSTLTGLASTCIALEGNGLSADWLWQHPYRLLDVNQNQVLEASRAMFRPECLVAVAVGPAEELTQANWPVR